MKVALDGSLLGARFSGVERSVAQLARNLPAAAGPDDRFILYVSRAFDRFCERFCPTGFCADERLEVRYAEFDAKSRASRIWWQQMVLPRTIHGDGVDLFHAPAYIAPALCPRPYVVTLYDLIQFERPELCTSTNRAYYSLALKPGVRGASAIIVPSAATRRAVARYLPALHERTVAVPLAAEARFAAPSDDDSRIREQHGLPEHYLLWVGNVEPKKNLGVLLGALSRLPAETPTLVVAGLLSHGAGEARRQWLELGLQKKVRFLGHVADADLPAVYRGADLFCFPSVAEGFGLPVVEAMAAGVPVLVSDSGALPETGGEAALVLPAGDPAAWAEGIQRLLGDPELAETMRRRGRERAAGLTWERTARETVAVYAAVLQASEGEHERASGTVRQAASRAGAR